MGRPRGIELPEEVNVLRNRIQTWRTHCVGRAQIPRDIWTEAILLAREFGTCRMAKAAGLGYKSARRKIALMQARANPVPQSFIELQPYPLALLAKALGLPWSGQSPSWNSQLRCNA